MSTMFHRRLLIAVLVSMAFAALPSFTYADHSWDGYHWARENNPLTLKLGDNVSGAWETVLGTTSTDWSQSTVLATTIDTGSTTGRRCRATLGRVEVCNSKYGNNGWLGIASIWASGDHITKGTVKVNDTYFNMPFYNSEPWRNLVMCQEVGHTLGLDHQDEDQTNGNLDTCMDYTNNPASNQHPNDHDYYQLETIYSHLDNTTTVGQTVQSGPGKGKGKMPPAMADLEINGPGQWGKLIHSSHGGWKETYELDFGGGHKIITHVIWAVDDDETDDHDADKEHKHK